MRSWRSSVGRCLVEPSPELRLGHRCATADNHQHRPFSGSHDRVAVVHNTQCSATAWLDEDSMVVEERAARTYGCRITDNNAVDRLMDREVDDFVAYSRWNPRLMSDY